MHSTLELIQNDPTATALEPDRSMEAPEAFNAGALERVCEPGLQAVLANRSSSAPIPTIVSEDKEIVEPIFTRATSRVRRRGIFVAAVLLLVAIAIAVGVGVSFSNNSRHLASSETSTPSNSSFILSHGIAKGSSFATVSASDGSRYVFCQDINGSLRQELYIDTVSQASTNNTDYIIPNTDNARSNTPLSADFIEIPNLGGPSFTYLYLFYITKYDTLAAIALYGGNWVSNSSDKSFFNELMYLNDFATLPGSQALSVSVAQDARIDEGSTLILLLYEDTKGNITMLLGSTNPRNVSNSYTNWTDLSSQMYDAVGGPQYGLKAPMTSWNDSSASFMTAFLKQATPELRSLAEITLISYNSSYGTGFNVKKPIYAGSAAGPALEFPKELAYSAAPGVGFFMNGSNLIPWDGGMTDINDLKSPFPYPYLAVTSIVNTSFYIYHQYDESTMVEDLYHVQTATWTSTNITIGTN